MDSPSCLLLLSLLVCLSVTASFSIDNFHQAFPIVKPGFGHTKLRLSRKGLQAIEKITNTIASVAILEALNRGEIPSTRSLVEVSNKVFLEKCLNLYTERMAILGLPLPEESLQEAHNRSRNEAIQAFNRQNFDRHRAKKSVMQLNAGIQKYYERFVLQNKQKSSELCEKLYARCEDIMVQLQVLRLPSMAKFDAGFLQCNHSFEHECVGPSKKDYEQRMMKMLGKYRSRFMKEYKHKVYSGMEAFFLVMIVIVFIIKSRKFVIGVLLLFIVATWETLVYNSVLDLDRWVIPLGVMLFLPILYWLWRCYWKWKHGPGELPLYVNNSPDRRRTE